MMLLYRIVRLLFDIAELILLIRAFVSWMPINRKNRLIDLLYRITEPVLSPVRNLIARIVGQNLPIDFSPVIVLLLFALLRIFIFRTFF